MTGHHYGCVGDTWKVARRLALDNELRLGDARQREDLQEIRKMRHEVNIGRLFVLFFL